MSFKWTLKTSSAANLETVEGNFIWGNYVTKVFNIIIQHHLNASEYHLVNDISDVSVKKDAEH